jgi:hypothetical protein
MPTMNEPHVSAPASDIYRTPNLQNSQHCTVIEYCKIGLNAPKSGLLTRCVLSLGKHGKYRLKISLDKLGQTWYAHWVRVGVYNFLMF